jgi:hypothetical protein
MPHEPRHIPPDILRNIHAKYQLTPTDTAYYGIPGWTQTGGTPASPQFTAALLADQARVPTQSPTPAPPIEGISPDILQRIQTRYGLSSQEAQAIPGRVAQRQAGTAAESPFPWGEINLANLAKAPSGLAGVLAGAFGPSQAGRVVDFSDFPLPTPFSSDTTLREARGDVRRDPYDQAFDPSHGMSVPRIVGQERVRDQEPDMSLVQALLAGSPGSPGKKQTGFETPDFYSTANLERKAARGEDISGDIETIITSQAYSSVKEQIDAITKKYDFDPGTLKLIGLKAIRLDELENKLLQTDYDYSDPAKPKKISGLSPKEEVELEKLRREKSDDLLRIKQLEDWLAPIDEAIDRARTLQGQAISDRVAAELAQSEDERAADEALKERIFEGQESAKKLAANAEIAFQQRLFAAQQSAQEKAETRRTEREARRLGERDIEARRQETEAREQRERAEEAAEQAQMGEIVSALGLNIPTDIGPISKDLFNIIIALAARNFGGGTTASPPLATSA